VQKSLGRAVSGKIAPWDEGEARRRSNDRRARLPIENRQQFRSQLNRAHDVRLNDGARYGDIDAFGCEVFSPCDPGVVHENVQPRELFLNCGREGIDGTRIFHIELYTPHTGVSGSDLVQSRLTAAGDGHLVSAPMKSLCKAAADTAGAASYENGVAGETNEYFLSNTLSECEMSEVFPASSAAFTL